MTVDEIRKYRTSLHSTFTVNTESFEKNSVLLSTGLLAFSITFIKDIVKIETAEMIWLLFASWTLIIISIGIMIYYFLSSATGSDEIWKMVDDSLTQNKLYDSSAIVTEAFAHDLKIRTNEKLYKLKKRNRRMRRASLWIFLLGVMVFAIFVSWNLINENKKNTMVITNKTKSPINVKTNKLDSSFTDSVIKIPIKSF